MSESIRSAMMVVFRAALPFAMAALGLCIRTNQAVLQRNPIILQKLPTFDQNGFDPCKHLEEDQRMVTENIYCTLHILNTLNMLKRVYNPSSNDARTSDENITPGNRHRTMVDEMVAPQTFGRQSRAHSKQYQDREQDEDEQQAQDQDGKQDQDREQDQDGKQDQDQEQDQDGKQEWERKKVEEKQLVKLKWRKKMLRRLG